MCVTKKKTKAAASWTVAWHDFVIRFSLRTRAVWHTVDGANQITDGERWTDFQPKVRPTPNIELNTIKRNAHALRVWLPARRFASSTNNKKGAVGSVFREACSRC